MKIMSLSEAKDRLTELAAEAGSGVVIAVTRDGVPLFELASQNRRRGLNIAAGRAFLRSRDMGDTVTHIADDFDDPLPEDFLLKPLSET